MLERVLQYSIRHRWLIVLLTLAASAVGVYSLQRLPIDAVPDITNNQVQINTEFLSLSPHEIEKQVTFPIETALAGIPGLEYTRSLSRNGFSQVTAVFEDSVDIYFIRQQVSERISEAREGLPPGAEPIMGPVTTGLGEVYMYTVEFEHPDGRDAAIADGQPGWQSDGTYLTPEGQRLTSELERASYLRTVQDWIIRPQLRNVKDVAGVDSIGGYEKQFHVQPDPMKLVSYGLTFTDVIDALEKNNASTGAGYIEHKGEAYNVRASGRITTSEEIETIVLGSHHGTPIYVRDVAVVGLGAELRTGSASEDGQEVVVGTAMMLIGANSRTVAAAVDAKMADINRGLPPDIRAKTVLNRTTLVNATIETVAKNLAEGAILVIVILFLMLGNIRAALITALAIPLSMLLTATGMVSAGISGNLMSLGAIDFGIIVDGSVIIVENCLRVLAERQHHLGRRLTLAERLEAVFDASKQVRSATAFGEAIIITVYLPILALTGTEGKMFRPMAATVIFALVGAFVLSLTFIPAMVALCIRGRVKEKEIFLVRWAKAAYAPIVRQAVRLRWIVVPAAIVVFALSLLLFTRLGQEFVPTLDEKNIAMHAMRIPSTGITMSSQMQFEVERTIREKFPEVQYVFSKTGTAEMASDPMPPNVSDTFIMLKPENQWRSEAELDRLIEQQRHELSGLGGSDAGHEDEHDHGANGTDGHGHGPPPAGHKGKLLALLQIELQAVPGNNYEFTQPIQMRFNELIAGVRGDVAVKVYGDEFEDMLPAAQAIARVLQETPGAEGVKVEQTEGLPIMNVTVDRNAIARYGLNIADVQEVIAIAIGGRESGLVYEGDRRFDLMVRLPEEVRSDIPSLANLPIPLPRRDDDEPVDFQPVLTGRAFAPPPMPAFIPLGTIAKIEVAEGPNQISRENGKRRVVVQCNVRGRDIGSFVTEAQDRIAREVSLKAGTWLDWGGQFENLVAARQRLMIVVPLCFFLIFLLLFGTFNSVKYALMVFTGVPLALTGGIVALWLRGMPFSISAAVGFIALSGVAVLNGLVMVTFINQLRMEGETLDEAIVRGSLTRLRPVLMTALVAAFGFVPMALARGTGAEVQKPLATVVIGGIISSTILTLVVLPALYRLWNLAENPRPAAPAPTGEASTH
ncbi:MAG: CusA/CzcA family heavy metal efflux RND transporter [Phycisphaeraceae bacterium]|nr:CusA/CzcA family heavy metal efflux RND transporter [Phycisphaeraceae bacterium]